MKFGGGWGVEGGLGAMENVGCLPWAKPAETEMELPYPPTN